MKYFVHILFVFCLFAVAIPASQAQGCSQGEGAPTQFSVLNLTNQEITVNWINFECAEQTYRTLGFGQSYTQELFTTHEWVIRNASGQVMQQFFAPGSGMIVFNDGSFNPEAVTSDCSSGDTGQAAQITVINNTVDPVVVSSIGTACAEQIAGVVGGSDRLVEDTTAGTDWVVRYLDGRVAEQATIAQGGTTIILDPPGNNTQTGTNTDTTTPNTQQPTSANNGKVAFASFRDGDFEVYSMNPDGSNQTKLTDNTFDDTTPNLSPDGSQIAFMSDRDGNDEIYVMNADGSNVRRLTNNTVSDILPVFSPDGSQILFIRGDASTRELHTMNVDGSNVRQLTMNNANDTTARYSPDGNRIIYISRLDGEEFQIYTMNTDGSNIQLLTNRDGVYTRPRYSPDGSRIVFAGDRDDGGPQIYVMNADGSNIQRLTDSSDLNFTSPTFSPDGTEILFVGFDADNFSGLYIMNADGSNQRSITPLSNTDRRPHWVDPNAASSADNTTADSNQSGGLGGLFNSAPTATPMSTTTNQETTTTQNTTQNTAPAAPLTNGPEIQFFWNADSFVMHNPNAEFRVSPLSLEALDANGQPLGKIFVGERWSSIYPSILSGSCMTVRLSTGDFLRPDICGTSYNAVTFLSPTNPAVFWKDAAFRVKWDDTDLGTCQTSAGSCTLRLP